MARGQPHSSAKSVVARTNVPLPQNHITRAVVSPGVVAHFGSMYFLASSYRHRKEAGEYCAQTLAALQPAGHQWLIAAVRGMIDLSSHHSRTALRTRKVKQVEIETARAQLYRRPRDNEIAWLCGVKRSANARYRFATANSRISHCFQVAGP